MISSQVFPTQTSSTDSPNPTVYLMPFVTKPSPSETEVQPTHTQETSFTPTSSPKNDQNCWEVHNEFISGKTPTERLILGPIEGSNKIFAIDFSNGDRIPFPNDERIITDIYTASDGKVFIARSYNPDLLLVVNPNGQIVKQIPYQENWGKVSGWVNDHEIMIEEAYSDKFPQMNLFVVDLVSEQIKKLPPNFPNLHFALSRTWDDSGITVYDPTLQLVVYPELADNGTSIVLWDTQNKKAIVHLKDPEGVNPYSTPKWSPNGDRFFFPGLISQPLTIVYRDGTIQRSEIHLDEQYHNLNVDFYTWSPTGQYLAFWIGFGGSKVVLAIWDTTNDKVIDTCFLLGEGGLPSPVWSSDGQFLAIQARVTRKNGADDESQTDTLVLDFLERFAVKVGEGNIPLGWLIKSP